MTKETIPQSVLDKIEEGYKTYKNTWNISFGAYAQAAIWGYGLDKWISVKDGLPELKKHVWNEFAEAYFDETGIDLIVYDALEKEVYVETYSKERGFNENENITHYQYLPKPPIK